MSTEDPWLDVATAAALAPSATRLPPPAPLPVPCVSQDRCVCDRHAHDRAVVVATHAALARAWANEQARPAAPARAPGVGEVPDWRFGPADPERVRR